jgi:hypothetical protein
MYVTDFESTSERLPESASTSVAESASARNPTAARFPSGAIPKGFVMGSDRQSYAGTHLIVD